MMKVPWPGGCNRSSSARVMTLRLFSLLDFDKTKRELIVFVNGYGASVHLHNGQQGCTYEVEVMRSSQDGDYAKVFDTHITKDIIKNLTPERLEEVLQQIKALPLHKLGKVQI